MPPQPRTAAPWRTLFLTGLEKSSASSFTLSTIAHTTPHKPPVPRARTVEFRGFFPKPASSLHHSAIDALKAQGIGLNPEVYESELFAITTDRRMGKVGQIAGTIASGGRSGEGGEEAVEGVFWFEEGVMTQWRVRGRG
ncbi:pyridoxamine 5'-phosphate oxidase, partial [Aspergillus carlsbadensis]